MPLAADDTVAADLELQLSTPTTVVVTAALEVARIEPTAPTPPESVELALVIPRSQCRGDRPRLAALVEAARRAVARALGTGTSPRHWRPRRVVTRVAGELHLVSAFDA